MIKPVNVNSNITPIKEIPINRKKENDNKDISDFMGKKNEKKKSNPVVKEPVLHSGIKYFNQLNRKQGQ
jgi:hypothetical protein